MAVQLELKVLDFVNSVPPMRGRADSNQVVITRPVQNEKLIHKLVLCSSKKPSSSHSVSKNFLTNKTNLFKTYFLENSNIPSNAVLSLLRTDTNNSQFCCVIKSY